MEIKDLSDEELVRRLNTHPHVRHRIASLLAVMDNESGDLKEADEAEMRVIEEIRRMGQEALEAWATRQVEQASQEARQQKGVWQEGKKNCAGTPVLRKNSRSLGDQAIFVV